MKLQPTARYLILAQRLGTVSVSSAGTEILLLLDRAELQAKLRLLSVSLYLPVPKSYIIDHMCAYNYLISNSH